MKEDIYDFSENIKTKQDFIDFMELFIEDFLENKNEWENGDLKLFLKAIHRYMHGLEGYYKNNNEKVNLEKPTWKVFADILLGAKVYE